MTNTRRPDDEERPIPNEAIGFGEAIPDRVPGISNDEAFNRAVRARALMNPERDDELRSWLSGAPMACPVCGHFAAEGDDCDEGHFDELGDAVEAALTEASG